MSTLSSFSGGGGSAGIDTSPVLLTTSQTFTPNYTFDAYVFLSGGGGGGALRWYNGSTYVPSGQAGAMAVSLLTLTEGVTYTLTVGAGGSSTSHVYGSGSSNTTQAGGNGGSSSFSGSDITTMTAAGGKGGWATGWDTTVATASGGNLYNLTAGVTKAQVGNYYPSGDYIRRTEYEYLSPLYYTPPTGIVAPIFNYASGNLDNVFKNIGTGGRGIKTAYIDGITSDAGTSGGLIILPFFTV